MRRCQAHHMLCLLLVLASLGGCDIASLRLAGPAQLNAPRAVGIEKDQTYAQRGGQTLRYDLYRPADAAGPLPLVILVHGGSWRSGERGDLLEFSYDLAANGYAAATIDYRLVDDQVIFPAPVTDVLAAIRFFREQAGILGADADRIALLGQSAGGHLALLAGLTHDAHVFDPDRPIGESPGVRAIVNLFGPTDFTVDPAEFDRSQIERVERLLGKSIDQAADLLAAASPVTYVRADGPSVLTIHGDADSLVPVSQARRLVEALNAAGQANEYLEIPGMDHISGAIWQGPFAQGYRTTILDFLRRNL